MSGMGEIKEASKGKKFFAKFGLWIIFAVLVVISVLVVFSRIPYLGNYLVILAIVTVFAYSIYLSWSEVPQNHVWIIEMFKRYVTKWGAGLKLPFPFWGFITARPVYLGERILDLYMRNDYPDEYGSGDVDFQDISARVVATVYCRVVYPERAVYNVDDLFRSLGEKMDSALRSFLGQYTFNGANTIKVRTVFPYIMNGEYVNPNNPPPELGEEEIKEKLRNSFLYNSILENWGVEITGIAISEIILTDDQQELRRQVLAAEREKEAAQHKKEATITEAEGQKRKLELEGEGMANQVARLREQEMSSSEASGHVIGVNKWNNAGRNGAVVIETEASEGKRSPAGMGASFGAGYNAYQDKKASQGQEKSKGEEQEVEKEETESKKDTKK